MSEQKPLYIFRLDRETGIIEDYTVTEYRKYSDEVSYRLPDSTNVFFTKFKDFDKAKSGKVVSWEMDKSTSTQMIIEDLKQKRSKSYGDFQRYDYLISKVVDKFASAHS